MKHPLNRRFRHVLGRVYDVLVKHDFVRHRRGFVREFADIKWIVDWQKDEHTVSERLSFTFNIGVFLVGLKEPLGRPDPVVPLAADCAVSTRIGFLNDEAKDVWWTFSEYDPLALDDRIIEDICHRLSAEVIPFLAKYQSAEDVIEFLNEREKESVSGVSPNSFNAAIMLALWYHGRGDRRLSHQHLDAAENNTRVRPGKETVRRLRSRLSSDGSLSSLDVPDTRTRS